MIVNDRKLPQGMGNNPKEQMLYKHGICVGDDILHDVSYSPKMYFILCSSYWWMCYG